MHNHLKRFIYQQSLLLNCVLELQAFQTENQSTYIPVGRVHALENPGNIPLELVEVQSGSYLGEDDIVRLEDRYGRIE
jgi:hypothetical protein